MSGGKVFGLFTDPGRNDCLRAVSLALLKVRATGETCVEIAAALGCHSDTVENASNERSMLAFDSIARLAAKYPDVAPLIEGLWHGATTGELTRAERIERIRNDLAALERSERA